MKENKINIAELLKNCPRGMELDCAIYENVTLVEVKEGYDYPIVIETPNGQMLFSKYGCFSKNELAKCVIFPKGKTTWEGFQRPFKEGDIAISNKGDIHLLRTEDSSYCAYRKYAWRSSYEFDSTRTTMVKVVRLATEEEKAKLFQAIKDNGYKWNLKTKTLEKLPKFKVGDKIIKKNRLCVPFVITGVSDAYYWSNTEDSVEILPVDEQDDWELVSTKFDITTLVPFESRVLVRDNIDEVWFPCFFGGIELSNNKDYPYRIVGGDLWKCCIPYEGNEHLLGTTNDCDEYYKNW